jgi:hypothetical protein
VYTQAKTHEYKLYNKADSDLWDLFQDDFKDFDKNVFTQVACRHLQELRTCLRGRGVYIAPNNKRTTIAQTLFDVIAEEEQHEWTDNEIQEVCTSMGTIKSMRLRYRIPQGSPQKDSPTSPTTLTTPPLTATVQEAPLPTSHTTAPTQNAPIYGKEIGIVAKMYTEEQKYSGIDKSFNYKLKIFYDICKRAGLPNTAYINAFPTMLKGLAQDHFYNHDLSRRPFDQVYTHLRNFFEGPGYYRKNLDEWNTTTLASIVQENAGKTLYQCLQLLITKLRNLQHSLTHGLRTIDFFHNKLVTACQGIPACRIAISDPLADFGHLINKLQSSITAYEKEQNQTQTYFTDRRYFRKNDDQMEFTDRRYF